MRRLLVLCLALCLASCSENKYGDHPPFPASGQVLVNGQPAAGARVVFHHQGDWGEKSIVPQAVTGDDGRFVLSTYGTGDGAPAGDYTITVQWPAYRRGRNIGPDRLAGRFSRPDSSGLTAHVAEGPNDLTPIALHVTLSAQPAEEGEGTGGARGNREP